MESADPLNDVFTPPRQPPPLALVGLLEEVRGRLPPEVRGRLPPNVLAPAEVLAERRRRMLTAAQRRCRAAKKLAKKLADAPH